MDMEDPTEDLFSFVEKVSEQCLDNDISDKKFRELVTERILAMVYKYQVKSVPMTVDEIVETIPQNTYEVRNLKIYQAHTRGQSNKQLAVEYGLSPTRIGQIIREFTSTERR